MRKGKILVLALVVLLVLAGAVYAADPIKLIVNGRQVQTEVSPQIVKGKTLVPIRAVSEALGAEVKWDGSNRTVMVNLPRVPDTASKEWIDDWVSLYIYETNQFMYNSMTDKLEYMDDDLLVKLDAANKRTSISSNMYDLIIKSAYTWHDSPKNAKELIKFSRLPASFADEIEKTVLEYESIMNDYKIIHEKSLDYTKSGETAILQDILNLSRSLTQKSYNLKLKLEDQKNNCFRKTLEIYNKYTPKISNQN